MRKEGATTLEGAFPLQMFVPPACLCLNQSVSRMLDYPKHTVTWWELTFRNYLAVTEQNLKNTILENKDNKVGYGGEMEGNMFEEFKICLNLNVCTHGYNRATVGFCVVDMQSSSACPGIQLNI